MKNKKLVMIPGPTPVHRRIQNQMGRETVAFKDPDFVSDFKEVLHDLKELWRAKGEVFIVAGTGSMAMEMAVSNLLQKGDNILIVSHGYFGDRFIEICNNKAYQVDVLSSEWGKIVPLSVIEEKLKEKDFKAVTVTHVDTSTGVRAPVKEIGALLKGYRDTLYIVDGVCSTAAEEEYIDDMGIDILFTASQKALGVPPGLMILWASPEAMRRREQLATIQDYYVDFNKWLPIMHEPSKYFGTPAINMIWALKEAVEMIKEEGLEKRFRRHEKDAFAIQKAIEALGFKILAQEGNRSVTLTNAIYSEGIDDKEFRSILAEEGVVVADGLGPYSGKLFRLGHMGNIDKHIITSTLSAIERTLYRVGVEVEFGQGVGTYLSNVMK